MKSHELARTLLSKPNLNVICSIDISTSEEDYDSRVFGTLFDVSYSDNIVLLFDKGKKPRRRRGTSKYKVLNKRSKID